jgi:hypothetical protein
MRTLFILIVALSVCASSLCAGEMERVRVSKDKTHFVLEPSGRKFVPWGFNYDRDYKMRLIEDYWDAEWATVEKDFAAMKALGANVVRVHPQFGKYMDAPDKPNEKALAKFSELLKLAEKTGLYLDVTGLGCFHKKDVPAWYDAMSQDERWAAQAVFWKALAARGAKSRAVFCYDLMNEPISPSGPTKEWLAGDLGGKHYVQFISLDPKGTPKSALALKWTQQLSAAIRKEDPDALITVGLIPLWSGFDPKDFTEALDFISIHIYPEKAKVGEALKLVEKHAVGIPIVIEEMFPMKCSAEELGEFIDGSKNHACGWIGFYWGQTPDELREIKTINAAFTLAWLELFQKKAPKD